MQEYSSRQPQHNPFCPPPVPSFRWTAEQRRAVMGERNGRYEHGAECPAALLPGRGPCGRKATGCGRGTARRHRREFVVKKEQAWLRVTQQGAETLLCGDGERRALRVLLHAAPPEGRTELRQAQARARTMLDLVTAHGPVSGWGVPQEPPQGQGEHHTPYIVPKAAERCWRWWRAMVRALRRMVDWLARRWGEPIPAHRTDRAGALNTEPRTCPVRTEASSEPSVCRDQYALPMEVVRSWREARWAM